MIIRGYGGQGVKTLGFMISELLASKKFQVVGYPHFGPERRGSQISYFLRYSEEKILDKTPELDADIQVVFGPSLGVEIKKNESGRETIYKLDENQNIYVFGFITKILGFDKQSAVRIIKRKGFCDQTDTFENGYCNERVLL